MNLVEEKIEDSCCPRVEIAEYLDGELMPRDELTLELHFSECKVCLDELNSQKKVSSTLEILLDEKQEIELPENFTKVVTAKAESNLDNVRNPNERSNALIICGILFLFLVLGFGTESKTIFSAVEKFTEQIFAVGGFILHFIYTLAFGISTIVNLFGNKYIFSSNSVLFLLSIIFISSFLILSRMILRFRQT